MIVGDRIDTTESALIGAVLIDPRHFSGASQIVDAADFESARWASVWRAFAEMLAAGESIDAVTVATRSGAEKMALLDAQDSCAHSRNAPDYARDIRLAADRRAVSRRAFDLSITAKEDDDPIGLAVSMVGDMRAREHSSASTLGELLSARYETLTIARPYVQFPQFEDVHLHFGDLFVIAARRAIGKSSLAAQVADDWSETYKTRIYSLEMLRADWADRFITTSAGISVNDLDVGLTDERAEGVKLLTSDLHGRKLDIADHIVGVENLCADLRRFSMDGGRIAIVDYLGLLVTKGRGESRYEAVTEATRALKVCALQTGLLVVVLSQLTRKVDASGKEHPPTMNDLRDSGSIEQDADGVLLLHRFMPWEQDEAKSAFSATHNVHPLHDPKDCDQLAQFDFAKQRRGESFKAPMWWSGPAMHFRRVTKF